MSKSVKSHFSFKTFNVNQGVAEHVGVCAAIVFDHIYRWITHNYHAQRKTDHPTSLHDGHWWMYETYEDMADRMVIYGKTAICEAVTLLEKEGYLIKGKNPNNPLDQTNWYRLADDIENEILFTKDRKAVNAHPTKREMHGSDSDKSSLYTKEDKLKKEQQQPAAPAAVFSCLKDLSDVPQEDKEWITKSYPETIVIGAVALAYHPSTKITKTRAAAIKWFCAHPQPIPQTQEDKTTANQSLAAEIKSKCTIPPGAYFEVLNSCAEIGYLAANNQPAAIEYSTNGFKEQLENALRKHKITWS